MPTTSAAGLQGVSDALLVNVVGLDANSSHRLRASCAAKNINLLVVKNSLAARATAARRWPACSTASPAPRPICWGAEDIVSLAKEITRLIKSDNYKPLEASGGVMDGEQLSAAQVAEVSKWPSRAEH